MFQRDTPQNNKDKIRGTVKSNLVNPEEHFLDQTSFSNRCQHKPDDNVNNNSSSNHHYNIPTATESTTTTTTTPTTTVPATNSTIPQTTESATARIIFN